MYFISLGRHCWIAYHIKKYINNDIPTQFFDWSRNDFKCVLYMLNLRIIDTIFNIENIIVDKELFKKDNEITITFKNFVKDELSLLYHHDIPYKEYSEEEMNEKLLEFIEKYKRRHNRLIELIKTDKKLCFIYHIINNFNYDDTNLFNDILKSINKNINYILILLIEEEEEKKEDSYIYCKYDYYIKINLKKFMNVNFIDSNQDWKQQQYDWEKIFELIQNIS